MYSKLLKVIHNIEQRSADHRSAYLARMEAYATAGKSRMQLSCGNLAHAIAACSLQKKQQLMAKDTVNVGIITAYNDMLSAHEPYQYYPAQIKSALEAIGHSAQVAGGVPAMCDGVTQGQAGMDLSLFSRDLIAQSTAISLSHNTFDAALLLGICDKIAPGQLMGALSFGYLPTAFVPSGPMTTGLSNEEKVKVRQDYAAGKVDKDALQTMENRSYHASGTCTFYGTANTNQLVFEAMGLMLPGSAFVPFASPLRHELTNVITQHMTTIAWGSDDYRPLHRVVDAHAIVNGIVALLASGGSTNHTLHLVAVAKAAGYIVTWGDFDDLSKIVPLFVRMYPNGPHDINAFEAAGGVPVLMKLLAERGLISMSAMPVYGTMEDYCKAPSLVSGTVSYEQVTGSKNVEVIADKEPFDPQGGLKVMHGNLGEGVMKISAVKEKDRALQAPARLFDSQHDVEHAYHQGELNQDCVIVLRSNGPSANGMPELHKLMPLLGNLMNAGFKVALVTDGRLSGASGKVPSVIHLSPESHKGGPLAYLREGDMITLDANKGTLETVADLSQREAYVCDLADQHIGIGREWFRIFRDNVSSASEGATILKW